MIHSNGMSETELIDRVLEFACIHNLQGDMALMQRAFDELCGREFDPTDIEDVLVDAYKAARAI